MSVKITQTDRELVFRREYTPSKSTDGTVVRVSSCAYEALRLWSVKTGLSVAKLASEFILFAAERSRLEAGCEKDE